MRPRARLGDLDRAHRGRVESILRATGVFSDDEVAVALELFDETYPGRGKREGGRGAGGTSLFPLPPSPFPALPAPASSDYAFLGAFTPEDELVGYACYGPTPDTDRTWDLYWIAIDPAYQGTGSGTILLLEVERRLQGLNARMLVVETSSRSEYAATRGFYEARGYDEAARVRAFYAPADDRIIFTKRFQAAQAGAE